MNYFSHHIGDYTAATAHLTWAEDMAYTRLLRAYYHSEKAIPADLKMACRLVRAESREQRQAVEVVLREFFNLQDDGWHQKRADREIAEFREKGEKAKRSADARWNAKRTHSERNANASEQDDANAMRTHSERNANAMLTNNQEPRTNNQEPNKPPIAQTTTLSPRDPLHDRALELASLLRGRGASLNATDPRLREWAEHGVSDAQALTALETAERQRTAKRDTSPINAGYLDGILRNQLAEATRPQVETIHDRRARTINALTGGPNADRSDTTIPF